nr:hypothetical protein HK105_007192 [Polyrhizophydium stewartii]
MHCRIAVVQQVLGAATAGDVALPLPARAGRRVLSNLAGAAPVLLVLCGRIGARPEARPDDPPLQLSDSSGAVPCVLADAAVAAAAAAGERDMLVWEWQLVALPAGGGMLLEVVSATPLASAPVRIRALAEFDFEVDAVPQLDAAPPTEPAPIAQPRSGLASVRGSVIARMPVQQSAGSALLLVRIACDEALPAASAGSTVLLFKDKPERIAVLRQLMTRTIKALPRPFEAATSFDIASCSHTIISYSGIVTGFVDAALGILVLDHQYTLQDLPHLPAAGTAFQDLATAISFPDLAKLITIKCTIANVLDARQISLKRDAVHPDATKGRLFLSDGRDAKIMLSVHVGDHGPQTCQALLGHLVIATNARLTEQAPAVQTSLVRITPRARRAPILQYTVEGEAQIETVLECTAVPEISSDGAEPDAPASEVTALIRFVGEACCIPDLLALDREYSATLPKALSVTSFVVQREQADELLVGAVESGAIVDSTCPSSCADAEKEMTAQAVLFVDDGTAEAAITISTIDQFMTAFAFGAAEERQMVKQLEAAGTISYVARFLAEQDTHSTPMAGAASISKAQAQAWLERQCIGGKRSLAI